MSVTPAQHAIHTQGLQKTRMSLGLPKMPNFSDIRLNKSGTVGTEPMGRPNSSGGVNKFTELKLGSLGKIDLPSFGK